MDEIIKTAMQIEAVFIFCDIRGFSSWMKENQFEVKILLDMFYSSAFDNFGNRQDQKFHNRVAKLLGDGFLVVFEYEENNQVILSATIRQLISSINTFRIDFFNRLHQSTLHGCDGIKCSFGLSYGPCIRITIPGHSLDYVSHKINYASRLVAVAEIDEAVFEYDLWNYIQDDEVFNKRKVTRELKKMGKREIGVFSVNI